jgi:predicted nucleic acid-binding protein
MADKIVDASALAALAFDEEGAGLIVEDIRGHRLHAPALLEFELINAAWKRARRFPERAADFDDALDLVWHLPLRFRIIDRREVVRLAISTGLTAYDASYLWLAQSLKMPLVTLDKKLGAHAAKL